MKSRVIIALLLSFSLAFGSGLLIKGVNLIDAKKERVLKGVSILIRDNKIVKVGKFKSVKGVEIIDATGCYALPGLIDAHIHISLPESFKDLFLLKKPFLSYYAASSLRKMLSIGVTTVRDVAGIGEVTIGAKMAWKKGLIFGARPVVCGYGITSTGGHGWQLSREADGPAEFRKAVRAQFKLGADFIKLLPPYSKEEAKAAIEETHLQEKRITVHSGVFKKAYDYIRWAVMFGVDSVEHAYAIPDDVPEEMARKGIALVPTLAILHELIPVYQRMEGYEWKVKKYKESTTIFKKAAKLGIAMGVGTDFVDQFQVQYPDCYIKELKFFISCGYSPMKTLKAATLINARILGMEDRLGSIEPGKTADIVIVRENPLKNIEALRYPLYVIQRGRVVVMRSPSNPEQVHFIQEI